MGGIMDKFLLRILYIVFKINRKKIYCYESVCKEEFQKFIESSSIGRHFNDFIMHSKKWFYINLKSR